MPTSLTKSQITTEITGDEIWQESSSIEEICELMSVLENIIKLETSAVTTNHLETTKTLIYKSIKQKLDHIKHTKDDIQIAQKEIEALLNERTKYTNKIIKNWCFKKKKALYISLTTKLYEPPINFINIFYNKENLIDDIAIGPIKKLTLNEVNKINEYKLKQPSSFKENLFKNYLKEYIKTRQYAKTKKYFTALENFNGKENFKLISEYSKKYEPIDIIEILIESISISNLINKNSLNEVRKPGHFNCRTESNKIYFEILEDYSKIKNMVKKMESLIKKDQPKEIKLTIEKYLTSQGLLGVSSEDIESIGLQDYAGHLADLIKIKKTITQKNYRKNDQKIQKSFKLHSLIYNRILHYSQPVSTTDIINSSFKNIINRENDEIKNIIINSTITKQSLHSNNKIHLMNISARINKDTNEKLKRIAKKHNLTERELINHAVLFWLNSDPLMAIQRPINPKASSRNNSSKTPQQSVEHQTEHPQPEISTIEQPTVNQQDIDGETTQITNPQPSVENDEPKDTEQLEEHPVLEKIESISEDTPLTEAEQPLETKDQGSKPSAQQTLNAQLAKVKIIPKITISHKKIIEAEQPIESKDQGSKPSAQQTRDEQRRQKQQKEKNRNKNKNKNNKAKR